AGASQVAGLAPDTYYLQITNVAAANGTGCAQAASDFIEFIIEDQTVTPTINLASAIVQDTYCDNAGNVGDGSIAISITDDGLVATPTDFTITWYRGTIAAANEIYPADGGTRGSATTNGTFTTLSDLASGNYTVVINKDLGDTPGTGNEGCTATAVYNVGSMEDTPTLDVSSIQAKTEPDSMCVGSSGTLIINDADISGILDDYEVIIRQGSSGGPISGTFTNNGSPTITLNNLAADDYYVFAQNTTTGCFAATAVINVKDSVRNPQISLVSVTPNEDCGGGIQIGGLEVIIDNVYDENDHFNVQWFTNSGAIPGNEIGAANSVVLSAVSGGNYSVEIQNTNTGCISVKNFTIPTQDELLFITDYSVDNVSYCVDNGSFAVRRISFGGVNIDSAQMVVDGVYDLEVYTTPGDVLSGTPATNPNQFLIEDLGVGSYYALIRKTDSQCESDRIFFDIEENIILPDVTISIVAADSTCSASGTPAGSLSAEADGNDDTNTDYTFEWFTGSGVGSPTGITTSTISGLSSGTYTVRVTYIPSGCSQTTELNVPSAPADLEIVSVTATGATTCVPPDGTITVTSVSSGLTTDYDFDYYDTDPTVGGATPVFTGVAGAAYTTAQAGIYWIIGTHSTLDCVTEPFQTTVNDNTVLPEITLDDFDFQTNCDPSNPNGELLVLADGQPENATYDFEWYFGTGTGNPLTSDDYTGGGNLMGESTNVVSGIAAGLYTVEVTNTITGCIITETYEMVDNIPNPIAISTSSSANTSCINPNGKAAVSVISPALGRSINDYSYYWFIGDLATVGTNPNPANADYTGTLIEGIANGQYVVYVIDQIDNFCQSEAVEVTVEDGTRRPTFELTTNDVTVCFTEKDGFASVSVQDISTVDIAWYDDSNALIGTSFFVDNLDAGTYRLVLTHVVTGCTAETNFDIFNNAITPSDPFVLVNNGRNNCQFANGSAIANVDGVTNNYLFEWFDPSDMTTPYTTGSQVFNLDTTTYLVRATNLATGCESAFTSVEIGYEVIDPVYEVIFNNSVCLRTEDGSTNQFTGTAIISFEEFQLAGDYEWRDANGDVVGNDSRLIDAYPGDYTVTFTAENGCDYSASFTIETSLTIYNGISANGDGKNDFFLVDCIDYFPNNNLQVFNRAGQKVYDIDGYNNTSIRFEGISNVGGGGLQLPVGTYFYIIDLGNGEDPVQGYLELVR
ncbi:gliding motility-associated C-terminal domain-containing protein, partial [Ekhidna sp.]|uniref:gliding motility-associated C-terminal domain-containing protein n=1 Tax=Ekhidna sp. TaxID=2608089 RepID=UPI003296E285